MYKEPPWAFRENKAGLYDKPPVRKGITPDRVSAAIEGYYHLPAVWVGEAPPSDTSTFSLAHHHEIVLSRDLEAGVRARVQRDGMFIFDFANWSLAPITIIPGYTEPGGGAYRPTKEHAAAEKLAASRAAIRAQLMNIHQACLATAHWLLKRSSHRLGYPVRSNSTHKALTLSTPVSHHLGDDLRSIAVNSLTKANPATDKDRRHRRSLDLSVVNMSFDLLNVVLRKNDITTIQICDTAYISAQRHSEHRYGESIVAGWTACEQMLSIAWGKMLETLPNEGAPRINKERKKKLTGRDYSASVIVEMLEVNGIISKQLYDNLERSRKARNSWAHTVTTPSESDLYSCRIAIELLMKQVLNITWHIHSGGGGGGPQWPVWMWHQWKGQ